METMGNSPERSKTQIPTTSTQSPPFPLDIISEILSRLSVKPLSRFRCVSKEWCSLISSSQFVKLHLKVSGSRKDYAHHQILSTDTGPIGSLTHCSLQSLISEPMTEAVEVDCPMKNSPHCFVSVVGSCHGLICIGIAIESIDEDDLFIWNPTIGKFKKVPHSRAQFKCSRFISRYAFGYDELNDDYKVVGIFSCSNSLTSCECDSRVEVMVYSLSNDSWRRMGAIEIENLNYAGLYGNGKYVNGKVHWAVGGWEIVSLDLAKETYGKVELPLRLCRRLIESNLTLGVVCDYLCVLFQYVGFMELWVMREYGVNKSWTKIVINPPELNDRFFSFPLCITENGEVVLGFDTENKTEIVVYDPKKKVLRYNEITNFYAIDEAITYVESLVSPVVISEAGREQQMNKAMD